MENKYTLTLTLEEMKMIRKALALESSRREEKNLGEVEEYDELTEMFAAQIRNILNK